MVGHDGHVYQIQQQQQCYIVDANALNVNSRKTRKNKFIGMCPGKSK